MTVETMIQDARRLADMSRRAKSEDRDIEYRRQSALERISGAVQKRCLDLENPDMKRMLEDRILEAATGRISLAEAIADCAEYLGDFLSPLIWWDLKSGTTTVWKGYVSARKSCRRIVHYTSRSGIGGLPSDAGEQVCLSLVVRRDCSGKQICSCLAQGINGLAVGIGETVRGAVVRSYVIFFTSVLRNASVTDNDVPESVLRQAEEADDGLEDELDRIIRKS